MRIGFRELLFLVVLFAIPLGAFQYVFKPRNAEISQARDEIKLKEQRLAELKETTARISDLGVAISLGREAIEIVEAKMPSAQNVDRVLESVTTVAGRHRLVIRQIETKSRIPAARFMELPIEIKLDGNFDGFYEFLTDIEQLPRLTRIKELLMKRIEGANGSMEATFTLSIYFQPAGAKSGATLAGARS